MLLGMKIEGVRAHDNIYIYIYINILQILRYSKVKYRAESGGFRRCPDVPADVRVLQFVHAKFTGTYGSLHAYCE